MTQKSDLALVRKVEKETRKLKSWNTDYQMSDGRTIKEHSMDLVAEVLSSREYGPEVKLSAIETLLKMEGQNIAIARMDEMANEDVGAGQVIVVLPSNGTERITE